MEVKKGEIFNSIQLPQLPRNTFDLTHQHCTTMDFADLVPICIMEAVPGDIFEISSETFIRLQPMITPMMHRCDFTIHYFFVPNRILWPGWEDFITGNKAMTTGLSTPAAPFIQAGAMYQKDGPASLANYFGIEVGGIGNILNQPGVESIPINALPFAAYQKIYWDYYVAKELQANPATDFETLSDGDNSARVDELTTIRQKGWLRDYFTSALPYAQKGDAVEIPLGEIKLKPDWNQAIDKPFFQGPTGAPLNDNAMLHSKIDGADGPYVAGNLTGSWIGPAAYDPQGSLVAGSTTINDLRRAMRLQEFLERNARAGTRYTESLKAHFDVTSSDARLQRAEYIVGVKSPIIVSEVLNTTGTEDLPQGNMSGHGIGIANSYEDKYFCEEHGWIIGLMSVTPRPAYTSGIPRFFIKRFDMLDYYWNEFANIGEQEILQLELQTKDTSNSIDKDEVFGYIPRYAEYKFKNDMITGDFADSADQQGSLRSWVMQRCFTTTKATLNQNFITGDIKTVASAPFAVQDMPIMVQHLNKVKASRLMPVFGTPTF